MKRKALLAFAAAGAVTAVIILTTGALAGNPGHSSGAARTGTGTGNGDGSFVSCLASHGVQVPSGDPATVKQWLADHQNDPTVQAAEQACGADNTTDSGPTPAELVTCLQQHGVDVPSDVQSNPDGLKPWLAGVIAQPSVKAALDACSSDSSSGGTK